MHNRYYTDGSSNYYLEDIIESKGLLSGNCFKTYVLSSYINGVIMCTQVTEAYFNNYYYEIPDKNIIGSCEIVDKLNKLLPS